MDEEPVCDCEEGELPDPDPGCCGADTCEETETCCDETTCVLTSSFQTDTNNCGGCGIVCDPGETCVDGVCVSDMGCCITTVCNCNYITDPPTCTTDGPNNTFTPGTAASCDELPFPPGFVCNDNNEGIFSVTFTEEACREGCCSTYACTSSNGTYEYTLVSSNPSSANCTYPLPPQSPLPCDGSPESTGYIYTTWSEGPCSCNNVFLLCEGFFVNEPGWQPPPPPYAWILNPNVPNNSCNPGCICPTIGAACNNYGEVQEEPCAAPPPAPLSYNPASQLAFKEEPCSQEECEAHVSTWMAEPIGEPNEDGLYKVKWILLDGCPGLCCSDQPTQPEFVKSSTLVDAPCKCGCN